MHECSFCKRTFCNKSNLNRHLQTAKGCKNDVKKYMFVCEKCSDEFTSKQTLNYHLNICKVKNKDKEIETYVETDVGVLHKQIKQLSTEVKILKNEKQPSQNITNNITNITVNNYGSILNYMTPEHVEETFENKYKLETFLGAQKALADFTTKNFLSGEGHPLYFCKDKSRHKFTFTDREQKEIEDINASILIRLIKQGFGKVKTLYKEELEILEKRLQQFQKEDETTANIVEVHRKIKRLKEVYEEIVNIIQDGSDYRIQLSKNLPSSLEQRILLDQYTPESDSESDTHENQQSFIEEASKIPELHDKSVKHIGNVSFGKLVMYKRHYKETGKFISPNHFQFYPEFMVEFKAYMETDL